MMMVCLATHSICAQGQHLVLYEDNMVKTEPEKSEEYLEFRKVSQIWAFWEKWLVL